MSSLTKVVADEPVWLTTTHADKTGNRMIGVASQPEVCEAAASFERESRATEASVVDVPCDDRGASFPDLSAKKRKNPSTRAKMLMRV